MTTTVLRAIRLLPLLFAFVLAACDSGGAGDDRATQVALQFATPPSATAGATPTSATASASTSASASDDEFTVAGSNGSLTITDVRLLVAEFELERAEGPCEDVGGDDGSDSGDDGSDCEEFEAPPSFVDLPLGTGAVTVGTELVPEGAYEELEFEVEDLDLDEGDPELDALAAVVLAAFPEWPDEASAVVVGTFTPTGGEPRPFTAYLDAEIEVELEFSPPIQVLPDGSGDVVTVEVDPAAWFARGDGTVLDLSAFDYGVTGELLEFELELERGFDVDHDEDDDEDDEDDED